VAAAVSPVRAGLRRSRLIRAAQGFLAAAALVLALPAAAEGRLVHATEYRQHRIVGSTPTELWRYIVTHPILDPDDGPAIANITHDHSLSLNTATSGGACRVSDLTFRWNFVITLPAADEGRMSPATRTMWREFTGYLKTHEEHHRTIFLACGERFVPAAAKLTGLPGCLGMKAKVQRYIDKQYEACMKEQRAFDRREGKTTANLALVKAAKGKGTAPGF
jgi:predicted secreted Zn-dependent protease